MKNLIKKITNSHYFYLIKNIIFLNNDKYFIVSSIAYYLIISSIISDFVILSKISVANRLDFSVLEI